MIIQRFVSLNPVEPSPLSFRAPMGIETKLDVTFLNAGGSAPITVDLAAQLQLVGRSNGQVQYFSMVGVDIANGKTRAVIPADFLNDVNGYTLRATGTVNGEPQLIAIGAVMPVASAGPQAVPEDTIDSIDLTFARDEEVLLGIKVWSDDGGSIPFDLTAEGVSVSAAIYDTKGGITLTPFSVTVISANEVQLSLTALQVNALPNLAWWSLVASAAGGLTTLVEGKVTTSGVVTPPFTPVVLSYVYSKPDALTAPAAGEIIHANYALDVLRIDAAGNAATLDQLILGDTIQIGVTTWSVQAIEKIATYYAVYISPATQAGVSGTQNVTFARP